MRRAIAAPLCAAPRPCAPRRAPAALAPPPAPRATAARPLLCATLLPTRAVWRRYFEGGEGVRVWCVSSTSRGGGVAEMMPRLLMQLRGFGVEAHWLILEAPASEHGATFFTLTKQLHNAIHGVAGLAEAGTPEGDAARSRYMAVCTSEADALADRLAPIFAPSRDLVLLHDPQPLGMLPRLRERLPGVKVVWRVHVGLDSPAACAASAWACLEPLAALADACVWSCHAYVREALRAKSLIIRPGISPLSEKVRVRGGGRAEAAQPSLVCSPPPSRAVTPHPRSAAPSACRAESRADAGRGALCARACGALAPPDLAALRAG